ncbi:anti-repressor SinI family protein [Alkalicoccobacillus porphyridii]|uniref:DNA-binding anti-repressor SinI n=1 Tax=Alkalicoccobacillus porphyridii TaxID=2597270 RepID=A0A554A0J3_9BACI|nr:anti-repressor SinI family protein [Alkalicoccobacillus porphyridii]TSB47211.1 DNA-binding anti-repressor SinI [Alkalicoccobacillus porphyridii]
MEVFVICDNNDHEWLHLVMEARELGLTIDEVRRFISEAKEDE